MDPVSGRKDVVYRSVLHTYMMQCLSSGHNIEFYIEGGRTRTGKPCMPKGNVFHLRWRYKAIATYFKKEIVPLKAAFYFANNIFSNVNILIKNSQIYF